MLGGDVAHVDLEGAALEELVLLVGGVLEALGVVVRGRALIVVEELQGDVALLQWTGAQREGRIGEGAMGNGVMWW